MNRPGMSLATVIALYYYRARYYSPALGRFISQDPLGLAASDTNLYSYGSNNPLQFTDPSGLDKSIADIAHELNQCAADLADTLSVASFFRVSSDSLIGQAFLGTDFSTISNIATGRGLVRGMGTMLLSNPSDYSASAAAGRRILRIPVHTDVATFIENGVGDTFFKTFIHPLGDTAQGLRLAHGISSVFSGKFLWDAGTYLGAVIACAQ